MSWIIRHTSRSTIGTEARPVGDVYMTGPHFGQDVFSHTYDPNEAAAFSRKEDAENMIAQHSWNKAYATELRDAPTLGRIAALREP